jgi:K+-sensing histidine kinase KdpD
MMAVPSMFLVAVGSGLVGGLIGAGLAFAGMQRRRAPHGAHRAGMPTLLATVELERRCTVATLCSDLAHDLAGPISYLGLLVRELGAGAPPSTEELNVAQEELERLQRLVRTLRTVRMPDPALSPVPLRPVIEHAIATLRPARVAVEVPGGLVVESDHQALAILLRQLLQNGLEAAGTGPVGVRAVTGATGITIEVWDSGPGVTHHERGLFRPWTWLRQDGRGLGLAVAGRLARILGWDVATGRDGDRTWFRLSGRPAATPRVRPGEQRGGCDESTQLPHRG